MPCQSGGNRIECGVNGLHTHLWPQIVLDRQRHLAQAYGRGVKRAQIPMQYHAAPYLLPVFPYMVCARGNRLRLTSDTPGHAGGEHDGVPCGKSHTPDSRASTLRAQHALKHARSGALWRSSHTETLDVVVHCKLKHKVLFLADVPTHAQRKEPNAHHHLFRNRTGPQCAATKRAFDRLGAPYTVVDITTDPVALATLQEAGFRQAPVVFVDSDFWTGYRPDRIRDVARRLQTVSSASGVLA